MFVTSMLILCACSASCKAKREVKKAAKEASSAIESIASDTAAAELVNENNGYVGDWVLITYICCGRTTSTQKFKPEDAMKTMHLGAENDYFTINKMDNGSKKAGKYIVEDKNEFGPSIQLGSDYAAMFKQYGNDTLVLNWGYMDLQTEVYLRKK